MRSSVSRARRCREKRVRRTVEIKTIDSVRMSVRLRLENAEPRGLGHFLLPRSARIERAEHALPGSGVRDPTLPRAARICRQSGRARRRCAGGISQPHGKNETSRAYRRHHRRRRLRLWLLLRVRVSRRAPPRVTSWILPSRRGAAIVLGERLALQRGRGSDTTATDAFAVQR